MPDHTDIDKLRELRGPEVGHINFGGGMAEKYLGDGRWQVFLEDERHCPRLRHGIAHEAHEYSYVYQCSYADRGLTTGSTYCDGLAERGEPFPSIVAELVGLRTEVDQLRNTFIGDPKCSGCAGGGLVWSGAEYAGTREYVGCPDCEGTGVAPPGLYGTVRSLLSNLWDVRAERDAALAEVDQLRGENAQLTRERDLAIAHDTQPYPTAWAYEQACRVMHEAKAERDALQARIDALESSAFEAAGFTRGTERAAIVQLIHDEQAVYIHDPHNWQLQHEPTHERVVWRGPWVPEPRCPGCRQQRLRDLRAGHDQNVCSTVAALGVDPQKETGE